MAVSDAQILGRTVDAILDNRVKLTTADNAPVSGGNPVPVSNFMVEVAKGNVPGQTAVNKFGHNPLALATGADVWSGGGTYAFYPTVAQTMEAVSTSPEDGAGGTGVTTIVVEGLDTNWEVQTETVIMTGTTPKDLANSYIRMYRAYGVTVGTNGTNVGAIAIRETGAGAIGAFIGVEDGQTQQAIYTVPAGKTAYFVKGYVAMMNTDKNGTDATFKWYMRGNNGGPYCWQTKGEVGLVNIGNSYWIYEYGIPAGPIPAKTDVRIAMTKASETHSVEGGFDLLLVDN